MKSILTLIIATFFFAFCVPVPHQPPQSAKPPAGLHK